MKLNSIYGNANVIAHLKSALQTNSLPHAVLITAPDGCGRGFTARSLAADYLFPNGGTGADAVMENQSSEVLLVEGEGKSGQIPIEKIRNVRSDIFHSSLSSLGRVVYIKDAHNMAAPAANALLKVLEEPPEGALFILSARDASLLPQTIVSRCSLYPLAPVSEQECEHFLAKICNNIPAKTISMVSAVYGGRIGTALSVLQDENRYNILQDAIFVSEFASKGDAYGLLKVFAKYEGRADGDRMVRDTLLSDISDVLSCIFRGKDIDSLPFISPQVATRLIPVILEGRQNLKSNASPKTVFSKISILLTRNL